MCSELLCGSQTGHDVDATDMKGGTVALSEESETELLPGKTPPGL